MSFHPNEIQRRGRVAGGLVGAILALMSAAFFRTQVIEHERFAMRSEENRLEKIPVPAPRGMIRDRSGEVIAENIPGYTVSLLARNADSLRAELRRLASVVVLSADDIEGIVKKYQRDRHRPVVILGNANFAQISVLEEHRTEFPALIIQSTPKRYYPDSGAVWTLTGYTGEINDDELNSPRFRDREYRPGHQVGKIGLERQYEEQLRGREGARFVEVDSRGRVVREAGARPDLLPEPAPDLLTNIDLDLQRFTAALMDTLQGGAVALDPVTGGVLMIHSAPSVDPNRFIGGISRPLFDSLNTDPRRPLVNKALQGYYPPASTFKLATAALALQDGVVGLQDRMPQPCTGGYLFGSRYFRCWEEQGHGALTLAQAIAKSCDVYFYQLGLKLTLSRLLAGGVSLHFDQRTGIDLPNEQRSLWPQDVEYYNRRYGPRGWTNATTLNLAIGQGENSQTVINMARFYTALATDGHMATPSIVQRPPQRTKVLNLTDEQMAGLREAMIDVISARGTAASAAIQNVVIAGKTGTAQNPHGADHAWFVGFAPAEDPKIVVAVFLEFGLHGYAAARVASKVIERYLKRPAIAPPDIPGE